MPNFTTIEKVKQYLRIKNNTDDLLIQSLITSASLFIENYLNRKLELNTYTKKFDGTNRDYYCVEHYPLVSVDYVKVNGVNKEILGITDDQVIINGNLTKGRLNCEIRFTAGYETTPEDIEQSCIELVGMRYKQIETLNLSSKAIAGETTSFIVKDMPDFVKVILLEYKSVNIFK